MISVSQTQLKAFRAIRDAFPATERIPPPGSWRKSTSDDVWIRTISQVVVVGRAEPAKRLWEPSIRRRISWKKLSQIPIATARREVWRVLREINARFAGKTITPCRKTKAIMKNRAVLMAYPGGPKSFLRDAATAEGGDAARVAFVAGHLSYFKDKGARDFLTSGFGVLRNSIAIDSRIRNVLAHVGIKLPSKKLSKAQYALVEQTLLDQVCKPLKITGAQLDQLLFRNYDQIMARAW